MELQIWFLTRLQGKIFAEGIVQSLAHRLALRTFQVGVPFQELAGIVLA